MKSFAVAAVPALAVARTSTSAAIELNKSYFDPRLHDLLNSSVVYQQNTNY